MPQITIQLILKQHIYTIITYDRWSVIKSASKMIARVENWIALIFLLNVTLRGMIIGQDIYSNETTYTFQFMSDLIRH